MVSNPIPMLSYPGLLHPSYHAFFLAGIQCIGNDVLCLDIIRDISKIFLAWKRPGGTGSSIPVRQTLWTLQYSFDRRYG